MTVRVYRSTDAGAPTLNGTVGSFIGLLDGVLVAGYGSSTPAGWTKPYSDTNIGVYRQGAGGMRYLRVDDSATTDARIHAFESMTSATDYTTNHWTSALGNVSSTTGWAVKKSTTADSVARAWVIVATQAAFYCFIEPASAASSWEAAQATTSGNGQFFFGDFVSYRPNDTYNQIGIGGTATTAGNGQLGTFSTSISSSGATGHYMCRTFLGLGSGAIFHKGVPGVYASTSCIGGAYSFAATNPFPDPITGGILLSQVEIAEINQGNGHIIRGRMPGVWAPITALAAMHGDIITGTGVTAGKTLLVVGIWSGSATGRLLVEISDTW